MFIHIQSNSLLRPMCSIVAVSFDVRASFLGLMCSKNSLVYVMKKIAVVYHGKVIIIKYYHLSHDVVTYMKDVNCDVYTTHTCTASLHQAMR